MLVGTGTPLCAVPRVVPFIDRLTGRACAGVGVFAVAGFDVLGVEDRASVASRTLGDHARGRP